MLAAEEFSVLEASNGEQTLAIWQTNHTGIDLLVSDISMPGMSGIDLVNRLGRESGYLKPLLFPGFRSCSTSPAPCGARCHFCRNLFPPSRYRARSALF